MGSVIMEPIVCSIFFCLLDFRGVISKNTTPIVFIKSVAGGDGVRSVSVDLTCGQ